VVVALIAVAVVLVMGGGGDKTASKKDREVLLESTASAGPAPFMPSLQPVSATVPTTVTTTPPVTAAPTPSGRVAQGPFGGTGDNTLCDRELLVQFLTTPSNAAIAREWARVLDIQVSQIPTYVRALIPTTLTADARVTNHTWQNGRAVGYQAVLERGTAVLVDTNGRLIARCRCGNPLLPPQEVQGPPIYTGPKWEGFDPTVIVIVVPSPQPIYPPGGVGTLPQSTTAAPNAGQQKAIDIVATAIDDCYAKVIMEGTSKEGQSGLGPSSVFSAVPTDQPGVFIVTRTTPNGGSWVWRVDTRTKQATPANGNAEHFTAETSPSGASCQDLFTGQLDGKKAPSTTTTTPSSLIDGTYTLVLTPGTYCDGVQVTGGEAATMTVQGNTMILTGSDGSTYPGTVERTGRTFHLATSVSGITGTIDGTIDNAGNITGTESITGDVNCQLPFTGRRD